MFEKETVEVTCPKCGHKSQENVGRLKSDGYTCPECGITLDANQLAVALKEAERRREIEGENCQAQEAPGFLISVQAVLLRRLSLATVNANRNLIQMIFG